MNAPEILKASVSAELPPSENNPRNSEGDFAQLKNGSILFAYSKYHGSSSEDEAPCDIAGMISYDNGNSFEHLEKPLVTAKEHNTQNIMSVSFCRLNDGTLCLFYLAKFAPNSVYYMRRIDEENLTLGEAETCIELDNDIYYVVNNCRICKLPDGRLLVPAAVHKVNRDGDTERGEYFGSCRIFGCDADGKNWQAVSPFIEMPNPAHSETGLQEPGISILPDGRLHAYFRTDRCFQFEAFSSDEGKSWSAPVPSRFTSPESPMLIAKNPYSQKYYAIWNPVPNYNGRISEKVWCHAGRFPFVIAQSENGTDFSDFAFIEDIPEHGYCYPAVHFLNESEMLLSYCCGGKDDGKCLSRTRIRKIMFKI
ncbi:MAG: glycoside hydrolase [Clostridia bacterium]|nr:glycoside hydrolase [Clostridia bacterium]